MKKPHNRENAGVRFSWRALFGGLHHLSLLWSETKGLLFSMGQRWFYRPDPDQIQSVHDPVDRACHPYPGVQGIPIRDNVVTNQGTCQCRSCQMSQELLRARAKYQVALGYKRQNGAHTTVIRDLELEIKTLEAKIFNLIPMEFQVYTIRVIENLPGIKTTSL